MTDKLDAISELCTSYEDYLAESLDLLWALVKVDANNLDGYSVIGALLSRQVMLSIQLARSPNIWNNHVAPILLRSQVDLHISLAWILGAPEDRAKLFILHGLGEEKLLIEHYVNRLNANPDDQDNEILSEIAKAKRIWINSQRREWLVEINLGSWSGLNTRQMAIDSGCEDLYKFAYKQFSQVAHNMWPHVSIHNTMVCENPLHQYHLVPKLWDVPIDVDYLFRSGKYVHLSYERVIDALGIDQKNSMRISLPMDWLAPRLENLFSNEEDDSWK
jgi:hypothetical protein